MENNQDSSAKKSCCSTDRGRCGSGRCRAGKLLGALIVIGLVAGIAFCAGSKSAQAGTGSSHGAKLAAQETDQIPTLRP